MNKLTKFTTCISSYFFLFFISLAFAQDTKSNVVSLPESVFSEWQTASNTGEYNGLLIHRDFIEFGYRPFMYQDIKKTGDATYSFSTKDNLGNSLNCELTIISKDTIQLQRGNNPQYTYVSRKDPINSERITFADIPKIIKKKWFTTDGSNTLEFDLSNDQFTFRNKTYKLDDLVNFKSNGNNEYRFIVKNENDYQMFYFKNYDDNYIQVGFDGKAGDLYKAGKDYPDYRIDNVSAYINSIVPNELRGNWLKADGSNTWAFSFYYDNAVMDKAIWNYRSVKQKGKLHVITLEQNGKEKTIYAKLNQDGTADFGAHKKELMPYTVSPVNNPNFQLVNDAPYKEEDLFKVATTIYSGIIRGFNKDSKEKTGMVHVDNVFSGNQDSYLVKIQDDGSFTVNFPLYYPHEVFVRFPNYNASVFVEPGKETWQFINPETPQEGLYAGDNTQINMELNSLIFIQRDQSFYTGVIQHIDDYSLEAFKAACYSNYERQTKQRDSVLKTRFLSHKTRQILDLKLEYHLYENLLSYDTYTRDSDSEKIDKDYISFLTPEIYNNKLAVVSSGFKSFINRLRFLNFMREGISVNHPDVIKLAELLKSENIELSEDDKELVSLHLKFKEENATALKKQKEYSEKYQDDLNGIGRKIGSIYQNMTEEERTKVFGADQFDFDFLVDYIKSNKLDVSFSEEEIAIQKAQANLLTKEEQKAINDFYTREDRNKDQEFLNKYKVQLDAYVQNEFKRKTIEQNRKNFGDSFSADVIMAQTILGNMTENFIPLSDAELIDSQQHVEYPFVASVIKAENDALKAKIEANKSKTDYVVNETPDTEADKIFDAIISKYKGKVIFVDFWATWCGPCLSGMKRITPLKEEMKDEDLVFVYITDPSSPETTYNNMIPNIKGEHYRVTKDEWNYLAGKFNISGIPHYLLLDKQGELVKHNTSDLSMPETVKGVFEEYLGK